MGVLASSLPQSQHGTHNVPDDASKPMSIDSTPSAPILSYRFQDEVFELLWLAFDNKQAVQGVFNVEDAVAAGHAEFVVFAWQPLMMKDPFRDFIENRTWQFCKEYRIPTLFVPSMYFLGHACGFDYAVRAVAVTFQEGSELTDEIKDMKRRIQRFRRVSDEVEVEEPIDSDTLEDKPDEFGAQDHICTGTISSKPGKFELEDTNHIENLGSKPDDTKVEEANRTNILESKPENNEEQESACSKALRGKTGDLEAGAPVSAVVLESKPDDLEAVQPMRTDSFGSLSEESEMAQSTRTDSFGSTTSTSSMSEESDDFDPSELSRTDSSGSQSSMSDGSVAGELTCTDSLEGR